MSDGGEDIKVTSAGEILISGQSGIYEVLPTGVLASKFQGMNVFNFGLSSNGDYYIGNPATYGTSNWTAGLYELLAANANATLVDGADINALVVEDRCVAQCTPSCTANNCGDDGCGGQCNEGLVLYTNNQGVVTDVSSSFAAPAAGYFQPTGGSLGASTLEFCAGDYYGGVQWSYSTPFGAAPLDVIGQGSGLTVLHGRTSGSQSALDFGGTPDVVVQGITTMDSLYGIRVAGGTIALTDVVMSGHNVGFDTSGGVSTLDGVHMTNPLDSTSARGMNASVGAVVTGTDVHFDGLKLTMNSSPGMLIIGASVSLDGCSITNTTESVPTTIVGASVSIHQSGSLTLANCVLTGNDSLRATIVADSNGSLIGTNTTFSGNTSPDFIYGVGVGNAGAVNVPGPNFTCTSTGCVP